MEKTNKQLLRKIRNIYYELEKLFTYVAIDSKDAKNYYALLTWITTLKCDVIDIMYIK